MCFHCPMGISFFTHVIELSVKGNCVYGHISDAPGESLNTKLDVTKSGALKYSMENGCCFI